MEKNKSWIKPALVAGGATVLVSLTGGLGTDIGDWYQSLAKPALQPPSWVFGPAWTAIYVLTAISATLGWLATDAGDDRRRLLTLFIANGVLNAAWTIIFFTLQSPLFALVDILMLWLTIAGLILFLWQRRRLAAVLLLPYIGWVSFATYLNAGILVLN